MQTLKYWGKRDKDLNLPTNSSISVTLAQDDLRTLTSVCTGPELTDDKLVLNGKEESLASERTQNCLKDLRQLRKELENSDAKLPKFSEWKLTIISENNFPTAAGLASSAAGFAALVVAIAKLYQLPQSLSEISKIARKGSGSACRSLFGGYVAWEMGNETDGSDSKAVEVAPMAHWPDMKAAILVVSASKKDTPSTSGMQLTVKTSDLFKERVRDVAPRRFEEMKKSIREKNWPLFAELTMKDSNSFHATCLDTFPPIFYMNDTSKKIIKLCHQINAFYNETVVAYTFDAGPNAVLYYLKENEHKLFAFIYRTFNKVSGWETKFSSDELAQFIKHFDATVAKDLDFEIDDELYQGVSKVILTQVGPGPQPTDECLIDTATGLPK